MLKQLRILVFALVVLVTSATPTMNVWAQAGQNEASAQELGGTRKQISTIIFIGLAGAVLGLSTLSFYGRPQDHLSNIAVGFAVGIITGTVITTYQAIHAPYEQYQVFEKYQKQDELLRTEIESFSSSTDLSQSFSPQLSWQWRF